MLYLWTDQSALTISACTHLWLAWLVIPWPVRWICFMFHVQNAKFNHEWNILWLTSYSTKHFYLLIHPLRTGISRIGFSPTKLTSFESSFFYSSWRSSFVTSIMLTCTQSTEILPLISWRSIILQFRKIKQRWVATAMFVPRGRMQKMVTNSSTFVSALRPTKRDSSNSYSKPAVDVEMSRKRHWDLMG